MSPKKLTAGLEEEVREIQGMKRTWLGMEKTSMSTDGWINEQNVGYRYNGISFSL